MTGRIVIALLAASLLATAARAETSELRISKGFGVHFLPLYVMEHEKLVEKRAAAAGLGTVKTSYALIDGGNNINDAMLGGNLDIASIGAPGFLTLWSKAKGSRLEITGLATVSTGSMYLNTRKPEIKTLADFTPADKIALPGIKTSFGAVILQMVVAKTFGEENYAKLDPLTVGMPYPEAVAALISGRTEITAHVASPPFSFMELDHPGIHRVFNSADVLGTMTVIMTHAPKQFVEKNPKLAGVFVAALEEAMQMIARDKTAVARMYAGMATVKTSEADVLRILEDPDTKFGVAPNGIMKYAEFMQRVGTIKTKPADWKELFATYIHDRPGS